MTHLSTDGSASTRNRRRPGSATLTLNVARGIHRLEHAYVNCYLVESEGALTLVDTAFPGTWPLLARAIRRIGYESSDVRAVVLTHAHFDHLGVAKRAAVEWKVPIWAHPAEEYIARHPYRYAHENSRLLWPLRHPESVPIMTAMTKAGALNVPGVESLHFFSPGDLLDVPGNPRVIFCPGHTIGHSALLFEDRSALLSGDALVTFNPYTQGTGPQIVSGAATADSAQALASLDALAQTGARTVLPGHGEPWRYGAASATSEALARGRT